MLLSDTVEVQHRVAISVARMAQALWIALQQPVNTVVSAPPPLPTSSYGAFPPVPAAIPTIVPQLDLQPIVPADQRRETLFVDGAVRTARVPILMYHYISMPPVGADIYRTDLSVRPELLAAHLDRIVAEGYQVIPLYDLIAHLTQGTSLPENAVVLTFDDGYRDNYENALPLLRERNMTATFFVVMDFINRERPEYVTWAMVEEMAAAGMSIEAHSIDHTSLRGRSATDLEFQALRSYETLQNRLGIRARFISYPAGEYDARTIEIFRQAGYWAGVTTLQGATHRSDALFELRRVRIRNTTTPDELAQLLAL